MDIDLSRRRALAALGSLAAAPLLAACDTRLSSPRHYAITGATMGTSYRVDLVADMLGAQAQRRVRDAVHAALSAVDGRMSTFDPDSELSRFNHQVSSHAVRASDALLAVMKKAQAIAALTAGAFDVTVGPLVEAWGFGPAAPYRIPTPGLRARLAARVGYRGLELDAAAGTLRKREPELRADLSGIAKGYGVDEAARSLDALGFADYLVEVGGELRARGRNPRGERWRIGIERPEPGPRRPHTVLALEDGAIATSGDYRIYFERDGERYSHGIEPASGAPVRHALASVSVVAADCMQADALSTALYVLGPQRGHRFALEQGLAAYFIEREASGGFRARCTPAFAALFQC